MTQKQPIAVLFYIRKAKSTKSKMAPIYMRITVNGKRAEISLQRDVEVSRWNPAAGMVSGSSEAAKSLNQYITYWRQRAYDAQESLIKDNKLATAAAIKQLLTGGSTAQKTLMEVFIAHNDRLKERVGVDHAAATLTRYQTTKDHVLEFMQAKYGSSDIYLSHLGKGFAADFYHYLITVRNCNTNTSAKYVKNLKRITRFALLNEWITRDPFMGFSPAVKPVERGYLTMEELELIEDKKMVSPRLEQVKDLFIFACYTGLAYIDVANLKPENISRGINGSLWINTHRQKTNVPSNIPLLNKAVDIIEKYRDHPQVVTSGRLLPVLSNQKLNAYLKEIGDVCGITKNLTFHLARHTFATTITLTNGVSIESVSAMLGHTNIKTTQIYAKVVQKKVAEDMEMLARKLSAHGRSDVAKKSKK
jgi:site-specific recombinase XerD